jgi:hypothetical protein
MWWVLLAASVVLVGLASWPLFAGRGYIYADLGGGYLPYRAYIHQQLRSGVLPLWKPDTFGGYYLHGEGEAGLFHPYHLMVFRLLDPLLQIQLEIALAYALLLAGCFFLFRRWSVSRSAALLGGLVFAFGGFSRVHLPHVNSMGVLAHMPWMLLCIDHFFRDRTRRGRWSLAIALLNASAILLGYPPFYFFDLIFQAWYVLWFYGEAQWLRRGLQWAGAVAAGILLGAPQWLSTLSAVGGSARELSSSWFLLYGSWHPLNLLGSVNPALFVNGFFGDYLVDEMGVVPSAGVLLLAFYFVGMPADRSKHSRALQMLVALAAFGGLLALGRYGKVYELWRHLPLVRNFRVPVRYFCMVQFALAGLCALALDSFLGIQSHLADWRRQLPAVLLGTGALITCGIAWEKARANSPILFFPFVKSLRTDDLAQPGTILLGAFLVVLLCILYTLALRSNGIWARATILILLLDLIWCTGSMWLKYPTGTARDVVAEIYDPGVAAPARISPPDGPTPEGEQNFREGRHLLYYSAEIANIYALAGYRTTNGYASLSPRSALPQRSEPYKILMGSQSIWRRESRSWQRVPDPLPPVRLLTDLVQSSQPERDISRIDYRRQALVAEPHSVDLAAKGVVQLTEVSTQESRIVTDTSGPMLCVLAQRFHAGWKAKSEGHRVALFTVYGDLTGFVAPAGHHVTELKFAPADISQGLWLAGLGVLLTCLFAALARRSSVVKPAPDTEGRAQAG